MSLFECKMCGGALEFNEGATVAKCKYCGTKQTLPRLPDNRRADLYERANHFRRNNEFDKAMGIYETILNDDITDAEAYWSLVLCGYGIEYVEDPATKRHIPTVNRTQYTSIYDDENYRAALKYADAEQREVYEAEAKAINEIQKNILMISQQEAPFDVFICYKETDANGRRTLDSVLAQELYRELTREGIRVFFARITLEDKLGSAYEPYIFAALNSAKVMVVVGTSAENLNAAWVKNEWSRYLALIGQGQKKVLIPAYRDMDPYTLPVEFSHLQGQDMSKIGFMQDLVRGVQKILEAYAPKNQEESKRVEVPKASEEPPANGSKPQSTPQPKPKRAKKIAWIAAPIVCLIAAASVLLYPMIAPATDENPAGTESTQMSETPAATVVEIPTTDSEGLAYTIAKNKVTITGIGTCTDKAIRIPAQIEGKPVTGIANYAFMDHSTLTAVAIPEGVTSIGNDAFSGCTSLSVVSLPESVTAIGNYAFSGCFLLADISLPQGLKTLGFYAFNDCSSLTDISVPAGVTNIGHSTFRNCGALTTVSLSEGLTGIGSYAFYGCTSLTDISIPESVASIEGYAFYECTELTSISIPAGVTGIGNYTFYGCTGLTNISLAEGITGIGDYAFHDCTELTDISIPASVRSIGSYAFCNCSHLTDIVIPEGVTDIGERTFYNCSNLASISLPESLTTIGQYAFYDCGVLTAISFPAGITSIGDHAFFNCKKLSSILFAEGITRIEKYAFYGCSSLTVVSIPAGVTSISDYAFYDCHGLTDLSLPDSITLIAARAFFNCEMLSRITYSGTMAQWKTVTVGSDNNPIRNAVIHCTDGDITK